MGIAIRDERMTPCDLQRHRHNPSIDTPEHPETSARHPAGRRRQPGRPPPGGIFGQQLHLDLAFFHGGLDPFPGGGGLPPAASASGHTRRVADIAALTGGLFS